MEGAGRSRAMVLGHFPCQGFLLIWRIFFFFFVLFFGYCSPLRQYFSLYLAVSPRAREKKREMIDKRKNAQSKRSGSLPYYYPDSKFISAVGVYPAPSHPTTEELCNFQSRGVLPVWIIVGQRTTVFPIGGSCLDIFFFSLPLCFSLLPLPG